MVASKFREAADAIAAWQASQVEGAEEILTQAMAPAIEEAARDRAAWERADRWARSTTGEPYGAE